MSNTNLDLFHDSFFGYPTFRNMFTGDMSSFEDKGDYYEVSYNIDKNATVDNININLKDENVLMIDYNYSTENSSSTFNYSETIPYDADSQTLEASLKDGELILTIKKKESKVEK